jgi:hypothetical protein
MAYGPDNDCSLDDGKATSVVVSPGFGAHLRFAQPSSSAVAGAARPTAEGAICIYRADQGAVKLAERRLAASRPESDASEALRWEPSWEPWSSGRNNGEVPIIYIITAWRKKLQAAGESAWQQFTVRSVLNSRHEPNAPPLPAEGDPEDTVVVSVDVTPQT